MRTFEPTETPEEIISEKIENKAFRFEKPSETELRIETTKARYETKMKLGSQELLTPFREAAKKGQSYEETESYYKRFLVGNIGEMAMVEIPIDKARTVYAASQAFPENYNSSKIASVSERSGSYRKDMLIRDSYVSSLQNNKEELVHELKQFGEVYKNNRINIQRAWAVLNIHRVVLENYDRQVENWQKKNNTDKYPNYNELVNWSINRKIYFAQKEEYGVWKNISKKEQGEVIKWSEYLAKEQNDLIFHYKNSEDTVKAVGKPSKEVRIAYSKYFDSAIPDSFLINEKNEEAGVFEIKCYNEEEMTRLVEALEYGLNEKEPRFGQEGLLVNVAVNNKDKEPSIMTLGFNPDAFAEYVEMVREIRGANETGFSKIHMPFVLRVLNDIPDELLVRLGSVIEAYGYDNFIIQKTEVDESDVINIAKKAIEREKDNLSEEIPQELLDKLGTNEGWR